MRKINEEEKKFAEEVGHVIVNNAIFHWSQAHHFRDHGILNVLLQMLFVLHGHKGNSPMGSPVYIRPILTLSRENELRIDFTELLLPKPHDPHVFANNIHGFFFLRFPSHLEDIRLHFSIYGNTNTQVHSLLSFLKDLIIIQVNIIHQVAFFIWFIDNL